MSQIWFYLVPQWFCWLTVTVPLVTKKALFSKLALNSLLWVFLIIFAWLPCAVVIIWERESYFKFYFIPLICDKYKYRNKAAYVNNRDVWNYRIFAFLQKLQVDSISADSNYFFPPSNHHTAQKSVGICVPLDGKSYREYRLPLENLHTLGPSLLFLHPERPQGHLSIWEVITASQINCNMSTMSAVD